MIKNRNSATTGATRGRILRVHKLSDWLKAVAKTPHAAARDPDEFELHLAAQEWALAEPLDINSRDDFFCLPKVHFQPYEHQVDNAIIFFNRLQPRAMICDDVGLGKTITAGLIAKELIDRKKVESMLVVCPKSITEQWAEELRSKFGIGAIPAVGSSFTNLDAHPFWITSYQTALRNIASIKRRQFDLLILDEAHGLRNFYGSQKPPKVAEAFYSLMNQEGCRYCLMLTATPIHNRLWDIFSQLEILTTPQPNPLGSPSEFNLQFIADKEARRLRRGTEEEFRRRLAVALVRRRRKDVKLTFPDRKVTGSRLDPLPEERKYIEEALRVIVRHFPKLAQYTYARSLMSSPWALAASFEKIADETGDPAMRHTLQVLAREGRTITESAKTRAVVEFARAAAKEGQAQRMIIFTMRLETLRFIAQALERAGFGGQIGILQGNQDQANRRSIDDFTNDPPSRPILLSTDLGAVGLNLQAGDVIVNYDLPWNPMIIEQRIGRVQRPGQRAKHVIVYNLVLKGTIEDHVVLRLMEKLNLFNQAIGEMEELLELCGYDEEHRSLEQVIMELVRKGAEQNEISKDLERMAQSFKAAEEKMREMREATEKLVGVIRPSDPGRRLTGLEKVTPRMTARELVEGCLRKAGAALRSTEDGRLLVREPHGEVEYLFEPVEEGKGEATGFRLVLPGTKTFDRIVRRVREGAWTLLVDGRREELSRVAKALRDRIAPLGMMLEDLKLVEQRHRLAVKACLKVSATVGTDRYETVIEAADALSEHGVEELLEMGCLRELINSGRYRIADPAELQGVEALIDAEKVHDVLQGNRGINAFCAFYEARLEEDLRRLAEFLRNENRVLEAPDDVELVWRAADADPAVRAAVQSLELRFRPQVEVEPVGVWGVWYSVVVVEALVRNIAQKEAYPFRLEAVPIAGRIISSLPLDGVGPVGDGWACPGAHIVPAEGFRRCVVGDCTAGACGRCLEEGKLRGSLSECTDCRDVVCARHARVCFECQKRYCPRHLPPRRRLCDACSVVLPDGAEVPREEVRVSAVSGRPGRVSEMRKSEVSDRWAFEEEMVVCEETGAVILPEESGVCEVSGKRVRRDALVTDEVTRKTVRRSLTKESSVSGRRTLPQHLVRSDFDPERAGLPEETETCGVCGGTVLKDEVLVCPETGVRATADHFESCEVTAERVLPEGLATCEATGKRVRRSLLKNCPETGKRATHFLFEECDASGVRVLPEGLAVSEVSGKRVRRSLLVPCEESGRLALPRELGTCAVTGRRVHPDLLYRCPETGLAILPKAAVVCEESGALVHPKALGVCAATGRRVRRSLLVRDDRTGQCVLGRLTGTCEVTGKRTLAENLGVSTVSGKRVLGELLFPCEESGRLALREELKRCEKTGKLVHPDLLFSCPQTGLRILRRLGERCAVSGELYSPDGLDTCTATGLKVSRSLLGIDEVTGRPVQKALLRRCERTGRQTTADRLGRSQVSGLLVLRDLLVSCEVTGGLALPDELRPCAVTGKRVLPTLLVQCEASGKQVLPELLGTCEVTGKRVLPEFLCYCRRSGKKALADCFGRSELSGEGGLAELLQRCEVTGRVVFPDELVTLSDGRRVARDRCFSCPGCAACVDIGDTFTCALCRQTYCKADRAKSRCAFCERLIFDRGEVLPPPAVSALRRHVSWVKGARYVSAVGRVHVEAVPSFWRLTQRPCVLVFARTGDSLEATVGQVPLFHKEVRPSELVGVVE